MSWKRDIIFVTVRSGSKAGCKSIAFGVEMFVIIYPDQEGENSPTFRNGSKDCLQEFPVLF